jgi:sec-independent protein translocase protein TatA
MMGDVAKGLKSFKKGMTEDEEAAAKPAAPAAEPRRLRDESTLEVPVDRTRDIDASETRREP